MDWLCAHKSEIIAFLAGRPRCRNCSYAIIGGPALWGNLRPMRRSGAEYIWRRHWQAEGQTAH